MGSVLEQRRACSRAYKNKAMGDERIRVKRATCEAMGRRSI